MPAGVAYRPWLGRNVGIEMEITSTTTDHSGVSERLLRTAMQQAVPDTLNNRTAGYYHSTGDTWDIKTDSSCGWEIASPAIQLDRNGDNADLRAVCDALRGVSPIVDRRCGLHVHIDCSDFTWSELQSLLVLWCRYEPFFFELMPVSRRTNPYALPMHRRAWRGERSGTWNYNIQNAVNATRQDEFQRYTQNVDRYSALNIAAWWRHQRIEVRLHSGTINYVKIRNWTMLLLALVNRVKNGEMPSVQKIVDSPGLTRGVKTSYICKQLGLLPSRQVPEVPPQSVQLSTWIHARRLQFTPDAETGPPPRIVPRRRPYRQTVAEYDLELMNGEFCIALDAHCPNERLPGYRFCAEHNHDRSHGSPYRDTRTEAERRPLSQQPAAVGRSTTNENPF